MRADLVLQRDGRQHRVRLSHSEGRLSGSLSLPEPALWWPHTHGEPALYEARLEFSAGAATHELCLGSIGFRSVEVMTANGDFSVRVNGQPIFCRGACWTPVDALALHSTRERLGPIFDRAVAAGMNMLRVGGTMVYESDAFYDLCDERGLLVWQDFMFANMDYPEEESFQKSVEQEALQVLARLQARPSLAILCGSSEGEQQAAMWGAPRELWSPPLFHGLLKQLAQQRCDDVPYWPSSAHGGAFPHQASAGTCSYYGVGAYLRPLEDARLSQVRFASECLAFANIPEGDARPGGPTARVHHPAWKARTPRDLGAGWDFDDVRDHYLGRLFRLDPVALRSSDHERFLALGSVVSGEVMAHVFSEWRRAGSHCSGGLVWFLKDFWPSAGWGILDANARPKAAYWYLRRALQPLTVSLADEGVNGLFAHLVNERADAQDVELEVRSFKDGETPLGQFRRGFHVEPRATLEIPIATLLEGFSDLTYAYRFGPPGCNLVVASLLAGGARVAEAFYFPLGLPNAVEPDVGLTAELRPISATQSELTVRSRRLAYAVHLELPGALPEDDYFNVAPAGERRISIRHELPFSELRGRLLAHNAAASVRVSAPAGAVVS